MTTNLTGEPALSEEGYHISSVQPTEPPPGMQGVDWHCYVIVQGTNSMRGYRQGSHRAVVSAVEELVSQLNERRFGKRGRVHLVIPVEGKS